MMVLNGSLFKVIKTTLEKELVISTNTCKKKKYLIDFSIS